MKEYTCPLCTWKYKGDSPPADCPICHNKITNFIIQESDRESVRKRDTSTEVFCFGTDNISKTALAAWLYQACQIEDSLNKLKQQFYQHDQIVAQLTKQVDNPFVQKVSPPKLKNFSFGFLGAVQMIIGLDIILTIVMEILMWMGRKEWDLFLGLIYCLPFSIIGSILICWADKKRVIRENQEMQEEYDMQLREWRKKVDEIRGDAQKKLPLAKQKQQESYRNIMKMEDYKNCFYSNEILHPIYQNREAVFVMYNMLVTGRCDTLKEAINAYEDFA